MLGPLPRQHLAVGDPAAVVDGHVQVLPARSRRALDAVGKDPLADRVKAPQALGVDVQQLAGPGALLANDRRPGGPWQP